MATNIAETSVTIDGIRFVAPGLRATNGNCRCGMIADVSLFTVNTQAKIVHHKLFWGKFFVCRVTSHYIVTLYEKNLQRYVYHEIVFHAFSLRFSQLVLSFTFADYQPVFHVISLCFSSFSASLSANLQTFGTLLKSCHLLPSLAKIFQQRLG